MIHFALQHMVTELNAYLNLRTPSLATERVVAGSLFNLDGIVNDRAKNRVVVSLVNIEEDRVYRSVEVFNRRADGSSEMVKPEVKVNLSVLFVANLDVYDEALKAISHVVAFFQHRQVFDFATISTLSDRDGRMTFDLVSLTFEQQNHLWGLLGGKYMPSVMYKVGMFDIRDEQVEATVPPVEEVLINE